MSKKKFTFMLMCFVAVAIATITSHNISGTTLEFRGMQALQGGCSDCWDYDAWCDSCYWDEGWSSWIECTSENMFENCFYGEGEPWQTCGDCTSHRIDCGSMWRCWTEDCDKEYCDPYGGCLGCDYWTGDNC
jgi:hypothetical protein